MVFRKALNRRAFALAGALVAARGGLVKPQPLLAQDPEATERPYSTPIPPPETMAIPSTLPVQDAYTFLVGGLDTREIYGPENTDTIMISRVEPGNKRVRTVSIPRDLRCEIPGYGWGRINSAYDLASRPNNHDWNSGADLFRRTIEWNFNLKIDGVITTNLLKMAGVIDSIGGITVINPYEIRDDNFPTPDYGVKSIHFPAGELFLTGEEALEFCRTRQFDDDGARIRRQHLVLGAALSEIQKPTKVSRIPEIVESGQEFVMTDIPGDVQGHLVANVTNIDLGLVEWGTVHEYLSGGLVDGVWYWVTDWSYLPVHIRGWLGVGYLDINRP